MKNHLLNIGILAVLIFIGSPGCKPSPSPLILTEQSHAELTPYADTRIDTLNHIIELISQGGSSGIIFKGEWDLRGYNQLQFKVQNHDSVQYLQMIVQIQEELKKAPINARVLRGTMTDQLYVGPGETKNVKIEFSSDVPYPEVDSCFTGMRNTPYSVNEHYSYSLDLSKIQAIKLLARRHTAGMRYSISDVMLLPGKRAESISWMKMNKLEFFPFIDKYGQFKHKEWPGKTHNDEDLRQARKKEEKDLAAHPGATDRSRYGGWKNGPRQKGTGHFRVAKIDGKWWMIDPEGYLFWSHGVVRVTTSSGITPLDGRNYYFEDLPAVDDELGQFYFTHDALLKPYYTARGIDSTYDYSSANAYRKYGSDYKALYADLAHRRLRSWGLNTIANSSDKAICMMDRTAYTDRIEIHSVPIEVTTGWWPFMDPFDPSFAETMRMRLLAQKDQLDDPWCLGFFVDNEIKWGDTKSLASFTIKAPTTQRAKIAMINWLQKKYKTITTLNNHWGTTFGSWKELRANRKKVPTAANGDLTEFNKKIIEAYFSTVQRIFKEIAPQKLYLGCRFAGSNADVLAIAARYCDVISYNIYRNDLQWFELPAGIDKPVMIGEFHFGAMDRGLFHPGQVYTENQKVRAQMYYNYVRSALEHPSVIGTHWHQFSDQAATGRFDGENFQVGFTDICDKPYYETIEKIREIGYDMYEIRSQVQQLNE